MIRVSSYRRLFEEDGWGRNGGSSLSCAGRNQASVSAAVVSHCCCGDSLDFTAAKALNKEGLNRFVEERSTIAALNDRLVRLIEAAHYFEEKNDALECQIMELQEKPYNGGNVSTGVLVKDRGLDAAVERLRRERDEILDDTEEMKQELEHLKEDYERLTQQRILVQLEKEDVGVEVDAVTAECLALREQVAIYEDQLADMEARHNKEVGSLVEPDEKIRGAVSLSFGSPDITPALDVKNFYLQLAETLQFECRTSSALVPVGDGVKLKAGGAGGSEVKELPDDASELSTLISELQKVLSEEEIANTELEDELDMKTTTYTDQVTDLECAIEEIKQEKSDLEDQMKDQCEDYRDLLNEKMVRDMEIAAYRGLVEEEEDRLCCL